MKQPDLGTSIVFVSILIGMLWTGNIRIKHSLLGLSAIVIIIGGIAALYFVDLPLFEKIVKPHQLHRIQTFLNPAADPSRSYHVVNSITAVSSGQLMEAGYLQGRMVISMFTLQIFENIAMHTGGMPLTGIVLPFVSYGGSSLMTNMLSMGLVLSVKDHRSKPLQFGD